MNPETALRLLEDPVAQQLLNSKIPARLAYAGADGSPRVVPIWFYWNGAIFVLGTAPGSPKVKAIGRDARVALTIDEDSFPPKVLLVRGTATVQVIDGVVSEYALAARRYLGEEQGAAWEEQAKGIFKQMARVTIQPEWVKILDFQTRFPKAIEEATSGAR